MKRKGTIWVALTCVMVISLVLVSCSSPTTSTTSANTSTTMSATTSVSSTPVSTPLSTPTMVFSQTATTSVTATTTGNWWDYLGTPQYGGTMTIRWSSNMNSNCDPIFSASQACLFGWLETMFADNWTTNPADFAFYFSFRPSAYLLGALITGYEFTDPTTFTVHVRQGVNWQNIAPANGRAFTAADIVYHFNRELGLGGGFTTPGPYAAGNSTLAAIISVTATDNYTVVFKWKPSNIEYITETMQGYGTNLYMECSDVVQLYGNASNWHNAIGTGPFILSDLVDSASLTVVRNPYYWGYDERHPQNRLPYVNKLIALVIPNQATGLAALRAGKIDDVDLLTASQVNDVLVTNPNLVRVASLTSSAATVDPRVDTAPFTDIKVRQAMQEALDLKTIAQTYYNGTVDPWPSSLTSNYMTGWGLPYLQWPQSLQQQYAYNPTNAKALLAAAGFPNGFNTSCIQDSASDGNLLLIVQSFFAAVGINMSITVMDTVQFAAYVQQGHKQTAIVYRNGGSLGGTSDFFRSLMRFQTGYGNNYNMTADPNFDAFYNQAQATTTTDQLKAVLAATNLYVAQQFWATSLLQTKTYALIQPELKGGYNGQSMSLSNVGIRYGFYCARLWIDQNQK